MSDMVLALEHNGHTYRRDGSIYFKITSLPAYGQLARLDTEGMKSGVSVDVDEYSKDDARDFVLWKATKPGEPTWDYGTGPGRPGWHLECSAMALRLLGPGPIDLHAGGIDLVFPHHENEIAQSEGATKQTVLALLVSRRASCFVEHEKMSKSLGNVYTVPDIVAKGYRPSALRYLLLSSHYRKQLNFTWAGMDQAEESIGRIMNCLTRLESVTGEGEHAARGRGDRHRAGRVHGGARERSQHRGRARRRVRLRARRQRRDRREGDVGGEAARVRELFERFDQVLGVMALRRAEDATAAGAGGGDRAADRGAQGRPRAPRLRRRRRHPRVAGRSRHHPGGRPAGHPLETEVEGGLQTALRYVGAAFRRPDLEAAFRPACACSCVAAP